MGWYGFGKTDIGQIRQNNEDAFIIDNRFKLYMVCDGMGGVDGGEVASNIVVNELPILVKAAYKQCSDINNIRFHALFQEAVNSVNAAIYNEASRKNLPGMGTTFVMALIKHDQLFVAHIGDSRCYHQNQQDCSLLTRDHVAAGSMNELTRVMGTVGPVEADIQVIPLNNKDAILLCSDGLNHMLPDRKIAEVINTENPKNVCKGLVHEANESGGEDNISVIYICSK